MHTFILQDYVTIKGATGVTTITQNESGWLDLTPYEDLVFWTDIRQTTGAVTIRFQTSPTKDDALFSDIIASIGFATGVSSIRQDKATMAGAAVPVARFVRWTLVGPAGSAWDVTFRVYVAANSPGM